MASLLKRDKGHHWIQFYGADKKRRTIRLGKSSQKKSERVKSIVEDLITAKKLNQSPDDRTLKWLDGAEDQIYGQLVAVGLVEDREQARLEAFINEYIASRTDLKPLTLKKFKATKTYLIEHFGAERDLRKITEADADDFRIYLLSMDAGAEKTMAENTVRKHTQIAKQFFNYAIKKKLLRENPLKHLPSAVKPNKERMRYISHEDARAIIDACPDSQWRLIFALARYGALRCPSEVLELKWSDIDWDKQQMLVRSNKTEHHVGQGSRRVPIFPDLLPFIEDSYQLSEGKGEYLIHRYRGSETNLRTQLHRIIKRAHVEKWPKHFRIFERPERLI